MRTNVAPMRFVVKLGLLVAAVAAGAACTALPERTDARSRDAPPGRDAAAGCSLDGAAACLVGVAFLDCPGRRAPALYCSDTRCAWVSTGCPLASMTLPFPADCDCSPKDCSSPLYFVTTRFLMSRGAKPWDGHREMNVRVSLDPSLAPQTTYIACSGCTGACANGLTPCGAAKVQVSRTMPGTFVLTIARDEPLATAGFRLEFEVNISTSDARICLIWASDTIECKPTEPVCATTGTIKLSQLPDASGIGTTTGSFAASFADGLQIHGDFAQVAP